MSILILISSDDLNVEPFEFYKSVTPIMTLLIRNKTIRRTEHYDLAQQIQKEAISIRIDMGYQVNRFILTNGQS